jgi:hypothetical protein
LELNTPPHFRDTVLDYSRIEKGMIFGYKIITTQIKVCAFVVPNLSYGHFPLPPAAFSFQLAFSFQFLRIEGGTLSA